MWSMWRRGGRVCEEGSASVEEEHAEHGRV